MLQIGTKNVYLYLPSDEEGMIEMGGEYEEQLKRWRFPMDSQQIVTEYVKITYPGFFDCGEDEIVEDMEDEDSDDLSQPMDKRLHRAKSFSQYDEDDSENDSDSDMERSRSRSQKFKDASRSRKSLTNKQFSTKRNVIKARQF